MLLDAGALHRSRDDVGEDRLCSQPPASRQETASPGSATRVAQHPELVREAPRQRLPPWLAALAVPYK